MSTNEQRECYAVENVCQQIENHDKGRTVFYRVRNTPGAWNVVANEHLWTTANEYRTLVDFQRAAESADGSNR